MLLFRYVRFVWPLYCFLYFSTERCKHPNLISYTFGDVPSRRAYWKCRHGRSYGKCCPVGYSYNPDKGCVKDPRCTDPCPPKMSYRELCNSRPSWTNPNAYQQFQEGLGWLEMTCPPGSKFDHNACLCEYHESYLPGMSECCFVIIFVASETQDFDVTLSVYA